MSTFNKPTNPPAFPWNITYSGNSEKALLEGHGMTLRDYMAAKAMQALISISCETPCDYVSEDAYKYADAMLKAREV